MDGVLYADSGVAAQIVRGLDRATAALGLPAGTSQAMYEKHGGTVVGLLKEGLLQGDAAIEAFYSRAYDDVDLSTVCENPLLRRQLCELASSGSVRWWLASNSPLPFVERVLARVGLDPALFHGVVCPAASNGWANKPCRSFFDLVPRGGGACLFDDAPANCHGAEQAGLEAVRVDGPRELMQRVAERLGVVPGRWALSSDELLLAREAVGPKDILGRVPRAVASASGDGNDAPSSRMGAGGRAGVGSSAWRRLAVEFAAPGVARVVEEELPPAKQGEMLVRASCSAISAGTERRVLLHGMSADGEELDSSIAALATQAPGSWPVRYGYCLVGQVEAAESWSAGARVFCFHPHASLAHVAESDALPVPDDVGDADAAFFANMETACSLVQDAAPALGERVCVLGAGVVGSLVAAVLSHHRQDVTLVDPVPSRLPPVLSAWPGVRGAATAAGAAVAAGFDVTVEVSGSPAALADAVRSTARGGRVVVGSLYGEEGAALPLGLRFHRSEMTLVASQVSRVAAPLSTRWTKSRRAELAWEMLRVLRPSAWVPIERHPVAEAASVYALLARGSGSPAQLLLTYL